MITYFYRNLKEKRFHTLESFRTGSWVHVEHPTNEEFEELVRSFSLEPGLLRDAIDPYEVPRVEVHDNIVYVFTRVPYLIDSPGKEMHMLTLPLLVAIGENFVVTVSERPLPDIDKIIADEDLYTTQKSKLFLQIFFAITSTYNTFLINLNKKVRSISVELENIENKDIVQFVSFERMLNDFLAALIPTNTLLKNLLYGKFLAFFKEDKDLIEDLFLNNEQLIEICRTNLKNIVNIRESYSMIMTNNLNRVIKLLTALTIIFTVPTIIASMYGMNVPLPFADSPYAFLFILIVTAIISGGLFFIFIKKDWF